MEARCQWSGVTVFASRLKKSGFQSANGGSEAGKTITITSEGLALPGAPNRE
jgi:hypothetical protein